MATSPPSVDDRGAEPDLEALLRTEARIERDLAAARAEADRRCADAAAEVATADADAELALTDARRGLSAQLTAEVAARVAALTAAARAEADAWDRLRGAALDAAAAQLLRRLAALIGETA